MKRESSRPEGCLSDFTIDRLLAAELSGADADTVDAHLRDCERCRARVDEIRAERDAFRKEAPVLVLRSRRPSPARWAWGGGAVAAAAAAILLAIHPSSGPGEGSTRLKGSGCKLGFYVNHRGGTRLGSDGDRIKPGDALQFVVTSREPSHVAVLSVDGARRASTYYAETTPDPSSPGPKHALPESTVVDETLGAETIYGVFCPAHIDAEALRRSLEAHPDIPPALDGCDVDAVRIQKEAPSPP